MTARTAPRTTPTALVVRTLVWATVVTAALVGPVSTVDDAHAGRAACGTCVERSHDTDPARVLAAGRRPG